MPIIATLLTAAEGTTSASITPTANRLVLVWTTCYYSPNATSVSGCGITWSAVNSGGNYGSVYGRLFYGISSSPSTGTLTISGGSATGTAHAVVEFTDCDAVVQSADGMTGGTSTMTAVLGAFSSYNNATFGAGNANAGTVTVDGGFTQVSQVTGFYGTRTTEFRNDNDMSVDFIHQYSGEGFMTAVELQFVATATGSHRFKRNGGILYMPSYMQNNGYNYSTSKRGW